MQSLTDPSFAGPLLDLLGDEAPEVRAQAVRAAQANWIPKFGDAVCQLLRDPVLQVRREATGCLCDRESPDRTPVYLALLRDPDPEVRLMSLSVVSWINRYAEPEEVVTNAVAMLKDPDQDVQLAALRVLLSRMRNERVPRDDLLAFLRSSRPDIVLIALAMIEQGNGVPQARPESPGSFNADPVRHQELSSVEAEPLTTNQHAMLRFRGLDILERNADSEAVDLTLPLLRDTNAIVRWRAFTVMQSISGQNLSESDPEKWRQWWATNKSSFAAARPEP